MKKSEIGEKAEKGIKEAKVFGWKVATFCFGLLFLLAVGVCILFATGVISVDDSNEKMEFTFSSPLSK